MKKNEDSLTKQTTLLMLGRFLSMPLAFFVPVILTRVLSIEEFGVYKQIFLIFTILIPFIDIGVTNSLYYLLPRFSKYRNSILLHTFLLQIFIGSVLFLVILNQKGGVARLFTGDQTIIGLVPAVSIFAIVWNISNIIEAILIVEKRSLITGIVVFASEIVKSCAIIFVAIISKSVFIILLSLIAVSFARLTALLIYLRGRYTLSLKLFNFEYFKIQFSYALPFGIAVIVNGFVANIHQFIVSSNLSVSDFAIFSIGCFQLPFLGVLVDSVARTSVVRITELRRSVSSSVKIPDLISRSCRKLWIVLFPLFVYLWVVADQFILFLFTDEYSGSVSIFRIFAFSIPVAAILVQHILRAFSDTKFIMFNNVLCLLISFISCYFGLKYYGMKGVAGAFVFSQLVWKLIFLIKCKLILKSKIRELLPLIDMLTSSFYSILVGIPVFFLLSFLHLHVAIELIVGTIFFWFPLVAIYWFNSVLDENEKTTVITYGKKAISHCKI